MEMKFYRCSHCGQIIAVVKGTGSQIICCGDPMQEIIPGMTDGAVEKHVPVYEIRDGKVIVTVGEAEHPMLPEHYIEWIAIQTENGNQRKALKPGTAPRAEFAVFDDDRVIAVYAYCNLHGLWKA